jgi:hypothetical protein
VAPALFHCDRRPAITEARQTDGRATFASKGVAPPLRLKWIMNGVVRQILAGLLHELDGEHWSARGFRRRGPR